VRSVPVWLRPLSRGNAVARVGVAAAAGTAVKLYRKLGYHVVGEAFVEIGILHYQVEKELKE